MRENNILKSLLKYICITISASFVFVMPAKANFNGTTFINGIPTTGNHDEEQAWGEIGSFYYNGLASAGGANDYPPRAWTSLEGIRESSQNEWALKKNDYGTIYGISACDSSSGSGIEEYVNNGTTITKLDDLSGVSGGNCWCKLTGVEEADGTEHEASDTSWAFMTDLSNYNCTGNCSYYCFMYAYYYSGWRAAILDDASFTLPEIKIATTKYVETAFADSVAKLNTAIGTVKTVVDNTIIQADRIGKLHTGKQNRPDDSNDNEKCPFGRMCLLISDTNGTLHWYPICDANGNAGDLFDLDAFLSTLINNAADKIYYYGNTTTYDELTGYSFSAQTSQPSADSIVRQLNETEWAVLWNNYGVVYGKSVCNANDGGLYGAASSSEQTDTKGFYCWCKMTGVARTDGIEYNVSESAWIFYSASTDSAQMHSETLCILLCLPLHR